MSIGTLFGMEGNPRTAVVQYVARENGVKIDFQQIDLKNVPSFYKANFATSKIPGFVGKNGYKLSECIPICMYLGDMNTKKGLFGQNEQEYYWVFQWCSFFNSDMSNNLGIWSLMLDGRRPYIKPVADMFVTNCKRDLGVLEQELAFKTFLVGESLTLADVFCASMLSFASRTIFDEKFRSQYPNTFRHLALVYPLAKLDQFLGPLEFTAEALTFPTQAKKEKVSVPNGQPKKEKPKVKELEQEDEKPKEKVKHPLDTLPNGTFKLDEWKGQYSNNDTRHVALPWFWQNFDSEHYSLWRVDYSYNDELKLVFQSSNLIRGFFQRLEGSRKFIFGCLSVYKHNDKSFISGAFVVKGQGYKDAFEVAPDWDVYNYQRLDPASAQDKIFVENAWAWDQPITVQDNLVEHADGKVFK